MVFYFIRFIFILPFLVFSFQTISLAQEFDTGISNSVEDGQDSSADTIENNIAELRADTSLDEASRTRLTELYNSALKQLTAVEAYKKQTNYFRESALRAPKETEKVNKQLNQIMEASKKKVPVDFKNRSLDQLDNELFETRLRLESLKNNLEQTGRSLKTQQSRPEQIRIDQQIIHDKLQELDDQEQNVAAFGNGTGKAQLVALRATEKSLEANLNALQMELSSHPPRLELLRARYELAIAKVAIESARLERLEKFVAENRESEAARYSKELTQALKAASDKHPLIRELVQQNFELGKEFRNVSEEIAVATKRRDQIKDKTKQIETDSENSEKKIALAGLSPTLAAILRDQRRLLPSQSKIDRIAENLVDKTGEVTLRLFEIEEQQQSFIDVDRKMEKRLESSGQSGKFSEHQLMRIRVELNLMLEEHKSLLGKLNQAYAKYLNILGEIDYSKHRLSEVAESYAEFLDENLLWVKSSPPIGINFLWGLARASQWMISPANWSETGIQLLAVMLSRKLLVLLLTVPILATFGARRRIKARLAQIAEQVGGGRNDRFLYTLDAIVLTILKVAPGIAVLYGIGWLLDSNFHNQEFARAVGRGLCAASIPLFLLQTFYRLLSEGGIAELHLNWRRKSVAVLRKQLAWLRLVVVPCVFLITLTANQSVSEYSDSLGRLALIVLLAAMSFSLSRVMHPTRGVLKYFLAERYDSWIARTRYFWFAGVVIIPLIIAGFAAAGYLASAIELEGKLVATIRILFVALLIHELALRGLRLYNRELALKKLREKRQAEKTAKPSGETGESVPTIDPDQIDISTINSQTMRLVLTVIIFGVLVALWLLWEDVLPALAILNEWILWNKTITVDGVETIKPVAVSNLLVAMLYILIALTATRNLPGVMEILIMNRFSIDTGSRHAINQLIGYALITATVILVASELGGQWSELQWLVAALGVGLGFGLQEIFANFVSGIILLFERPIRIGDTVTVGEISGTVSRIQIRATTITDWERKDLVVPNKSFITDQLVNWTRTDNITRILIPVGIAYGSDTALAYQIITQIIRAHPLVLKEPEATVFFVGFGESSLDFEIRVFVKEIGNRLPLTHDLHMQINREFNERGIEIPFPQRDVHLRSTVDAPILQGPLPPTEDRAG